MISALIAGIIVTLVSLAGVFVFRGKNIAENAHRIMLPLAVGVFLGIVFLDLVPETLRLSPYGAYAILAGFFGFFLLAYGMGTYHTHADEHDHEAPGRNRGRLVLIGDFVHNIADGIIIFGAFTISPVLGIATTIGIMLHELPQEIVEYGILITSGYSRARAALYNFLSASSIILGVLAAALLAEFAGDYVWIITGIAAGNLLYIGTSDFIPEMHGTHKKHFAMSFALAVAGVLLIAFVLALADTIDGEVLGGDVALEAHAH